MRCQLSRTSCRLVLLASISLLLFAVAEAESSRHILITQNVDESKLVTLSGNNSPRGGCEVRPRAGC